MFQSKRVQELESEVEQLRAVVTRAGGPDAPVLIAELARVRGELGQIQQQVQAARSELADTQRNVVETRDIAVLQEIGIYEFRHPLDDAVAYKTHLAQIKDQIKAAVRAGQAVTGTTNWQVDGSAAKGRKMVNDFSKLLLRAYNNEVDALVRAMKPYKLDTSLVRLNKTRDTIARLGRTMSISVSDYYHSLRVYELELVADHLAKVAEEKERERERREQLREERKAMQELKREEERLAKERDHRQVVLDKLQASGAEAEEVARAQAALDEAQSALDGVIAREANVRAGYVYVISNVGSFGAGVVKIGMTRRLEPMDRVRELGDASVPFRFDVHALIFSDDAVGLENDLHQALADRRVNLINQRREYFYTTPAEVQELLAERHHLLRYETEPEALEWHQSENLRRASQHSTITANQRPTSAAPATNPPPPPTRDLTSAPATLVPPPPPPPPGSST